MENSEQRLISQEELEALIVDHHRWLNSGGAMPKPDFSNLHLKELVISFSKLDQANFSGSIFESCAMDNSSFVGSRLGNVVFKDCNFNSCILSQVIFNGCNLDDIIFIDTVLNEADFGNTVIQASFEDCVMGNIYLRDTTFSKSNFSNVYGQGATILNSVFSGCKMKGARFDNSRLKDVKMEFCDLNKLSLMKSSIVDVEFTTGNLSVFDLRDSIPQDFVISNSSVNGMNATGASFFGWSVKSSRIDGFRISLSNMTKVSFENCKIIDGHMEHVGGSNVTFNKCNIELVTEFESDFKNCIFSECEFEETNLSDIGSSEMEKKV